MKNLKHINLFFIAILICSCKKEKLPEVAIPECTQRCDYLTNFIGHRWTQVGEYEDSSNYALSHIDLIPLATSYSFSFDSCDLDNEWVINPNGTSFGLNHVKCQPSEKDTFEIPNWKMSADRKLLTFENASTLSIESITPNYMKLFYYSYVTVPGHPPVKQIRLQLYKSI